MLTREQAIACAFDSLEKHRSVVYITYDADDLRKAVSIAADRLHEIGEFAVQKSSSDATYRSWKSEDKWLTILAMQGPHLQGRGRRSCFIIDPDAARKAIANGRADEYLEMCTALHYGDCQPC